LINNSINRERICKSITLDTLFNISQVGSGCVHPFFTGPWSVIISLWHDQTNKIASGLPIPAPLGSPHGPNQWFWGAPVHLALIPEYVVPLTVFPRTFYKKLTSLETTAAVKWWSIFSRISRTVSISLSSKLVTT